MEDLGVSESGGAVQELSYEQINDIQPPKMEKKLARNSNEYKVKRAALEKRVAELVNEGLSANRIVAVLASENMGHPTGGALTEAYIYSIKQKLRFKESRAEASDKHLKSLAEQAADYASESEGPQPGPTDGSEIPCAILRSESMSDEKKVRMLKAFFLEV